MLKSYLRMAIRGFKQQPGYTLLNVLGLTIGVAATLFILLYISTELRYDRFHERADRIYRISSDITEPDDAFRWAVTQTPLAMQLKADYPEVEQYVRFIPNGRTRFQHQDRFFFEEKIYLVDSTFSEVFTFDFLVGDAGSALREPNSIALSKSAAGRIFGNSDPLGEVLKTASGNEYKVTGVYRDFPQYSHIIPNGMISSNTVPGLSSPDAGSWGGFGIYSYVLLREGTDPQVFEAKLQEVIDQYVAVIFDQFDIDIKYELLPLTDIHLQSDFQGEPEPTGEMAFLYIFGSVALFILLIACINYMNLSTARAAKRALEVGIRKVMGSGRKQLMGRFLSESVIFTFIALVFSFGLVFALLPLFNATFDLQLERRMLISFPLLGGALVILVLTGIIGGSYPAFYLSSFRPITVLKGALSKNSGNPFLRKVLVTLQFSITLFMLVGTGVIYDQMHFLSTKDLGFNKNHVMTFTLEGDESQSKYPVLREKLLQNPKITSLGTASTTPGDGYGKLVMDVENSEGVMDQYGMDNYFIDYDFFFTLEIPLISGRYFSDEYATDSTQAVMVNEAMVRRMGWQDPIGRKIRVTSDDTIPASLVIGVVKDYHQQSLYDPISSLVFRPGFNNSRVHMRFRPEDAGDVNKIIQFAEVQWREVFPNQPFEYQFVDAAFMELYQKDQVRARIFTLFSVLMITIACLGLLGLASYSVEQRTKEIGIRKVMGANTTHILVLITRNFMLLVSIAAIPAFLCAWYFMSKWLDTFSYHTQMNFLLFGLALFLVLLITAFTTGYHALRAAYGNPVEALRYE